ncbi:hypothetical protein BD309DRAFT_856555 [Dichomitus squalens]|uniref:Uncharacterized protein n=1 Tax=Dichomitus squalens (strain LYAD-421) TaxID=732165 RepID=R7SY03_DICSQ|nr:uncharacterized protein DICSQDRAFT_127999 [Dichomitus squalens LYAD-421 SS1]EJF59862.1 hypothetical protein DICSQDRAFT_127999 [Dichomitus squalens LYAD-421 SS1]TBU47205.1 hypothetical protein BD309DRAFT_856555 [Dichomitus squalens]
MRSFLFFPTVVTLGVIGSIGVQAAEPTVPTLLTPTPGEVLGAAFPFKYVNPNRTAESNPRAASSLIGVLFNTTYQNGFFPSFSNSDPTTAETTLTIDSSVIAEGAYKVNVQSGSQFSTNFAVTVSYQ